MPAVVRRLAAIATASLLLAGCGDGDQTSLTELAEGVPADAAAWVAMDLRDDHAKAFARRVVGADPPDVERIAIWVRFRPDGRPETRLITATPRKRGGLAEHPRFRELLDDVGADAQAAGYYDPARLTRAAAVRAGLDPRGTARLLQTAGAQPAGGAGTFAQPDGRALVLDVRSEGCFTPQRRVDLVTRSSAWAFAAVPAPGLSQRPCGQAAARRQADTKLRAGALSLDRDVARWGRVDQLVLSPGGEVALGVEITDKARAGAAVRRLRGRTGATSRTGTSAAEDRSVRLPARRPGGRTTRLDLGVARAVLRLVAAGGAAPPSSTSTADLSTLTALLEPQGPGVVLRGVPFGYEDALVGVAADPDDEHRARIALLAP